MKFVVDKLKYFLQATLVIGFFVGFLYLFEHKVPPANRILACWIGLVVTINLLNLAKDFGNKTNGRSNFTRIMIQVIPVFGGIGMVHYLKGDNIGAIIFAVIPVLILPISMLLSNLIPVEETDEKEFDIAKF
jgi:hypothetical protein